MHTQGFQDFLPDKVGVGLTGRPVPESMGEFRPVRLEPQRSADGLLLGPGKVGEDT
jgi:hypothetical protein